MSSPQLEPTGELKPGAKLGAYRVARLVAQGGMANVYEATHVDLQKRVALKAMLPELSTRPELVQRFILEARAAARLSHPHVIGISDVGIESGMPFMVMDFLDGEDLGTRLAREGALDPEALIDLMLPVVSAVSCAHAERILHRDLKPENVFLQKRKGGRDHPVLLDFGLSKSLESSARKITAIGEMLGTPSYMAPEQIEGLAADERTDQYALAATMYRSVTGQLPYTGDVLAVLLAAILRGGARPPSQIARAVPPELDHILLRALSVDPSARFASLADLGRALWPLASRGARLAWAEELAPHPAVVSSSAPPRPPADAAAADPSLDASRRTTMSAPVPTNAVVSADDVRRFTAFAEAEDDEIQDLMAAMEPVHFAPGRMIIRQGAHGHGCYFLISGSVRIVRTSDPSIAPPSAPGTETASWVMGELGAGAAFGQIALVDNVPRTASVVATSDVVALYISRSEFDRLLGSDSPGAHRLREHVVVSGIRQLRRATQHFRVLATRRDGQPLPARDLAFVRVAAHEWGLPLPSDEG